jgi:hypothetical protein
MILGRCSQILGARSAFRKAPTQCPRANREVAFWAPADTHALSHALTWRGCSGSRSRFMVLAACFVPRDCMLILIW